MFSGIRPLLEKALGIELLTEEEKKAQEGSKDIFEEMIKDFKSCFGKSNTDCFCSFSRPVLHKGFVLEFIGKKDETEVILLTPRKQELDKNNLKIELCAWDDFSSGKIDLVDLEDNKARLVYQYTLSLEYKKGGSSSYDEFEAETVFYKLKDSGENKVCLISKEVADELKKDANKGKKC
jgi:hypothetical protein